MVKRLKNFEPGHGFTREDWDAVDSPEISEAEFAAMRPATEVLPAAFFAHIEEERRRRGRPPLARPKQQVTLRLDADVLDHYRAGGKGWQARLNDALRSAAGLGDLKPE